MAYNLQNGWTGAHLVPTTPAEFGLRDSSLGSRTGVVPPPNPQTPSSNVGPVNAGAQLPLSASQLGTTPSTLIDASLGSRTGSDPNAGKQSVYAQASVYNNQNAPAFLAQQVANLNAEQTMRRSAQAELLNRIVGGVAGGGPDAYLWDEALRAASVQPGAMVNFAAPVLDPRIGIAQKIIAQGYSDRAQQQAQAIRQANDAQQQLSDLQKRRAIIGPNPFGQYSGSEQQQLDTRIQDLMDKTSSTGSLQLLGQASAAAGSGWTPRLPQY